MLSRQFIPSFVLLLLAIIIRFQIAPWANQLPAEYSNETRYSADVRFRETPGAVWQEFPLLARRVDQVLLVSGAVAIIQGESHWTTEDGTPTYEPVGLYGVHRRTRLNVDGYGDINRSGQYLFPPHLEKKTYLYWDPYYLGPRTATFDHVDEVEGLTVYVFNYLGTGIDDTAGYTVLPDVPERYQAISQAQGKLWIEPVSGIVVDMEDTGVTDFVDTATGEHVADFYHWTARYTDETRWDQLMQARSTRLRILALETWLPLCALLLAGVWSIVSLSRPGRITRR
ncbi:MAG TPA: porin PorA family protein [Anaerolineales bacterium]|nr:porin PorA family protein [Anaerolineales bacterium]